MGLILTSKWLALGNLEQRVYSRDKMQVHKTNQFTLWKTETRHVLTFRRHTYTKQFTSVVADKATREDPLSLEDSWQIDCSKWYHSGSTQCPAGKMGYHSPGRLTGVLCSQVYKIVSLCHLSQRHLKIRALWGSGSCGEGSIHFLLVLRLSKAIQQSSKTTAKSCSQFTLEWQSHRSWEDCCTGSSVCWGDLLSKKAVHPNCWG